MEWRGLFGKCSSTLGRYQTDLPTSISHLPCTSAANGWPPRVVMNRLTQAGPDRAQKSGAWPNSAVRPSSRTESAQTWWTCSSWPPELAHVVHSLSWADLMWVLFQAPLVWALVCLATGPSGSRPRVHGGPALVWSNVGPFILFLDVEFCALPNCAVLL